MKCLALAALFAFSGLLPTVAPAQSAIDRLERDVMRDAGEIEGPETREPGYLGLIGDAPEQNGSGVQIREVYTGGPADLAGLKPGDIILMVADRNIGSVGDLGAIMAANGPGSKLIFLIQRQDNDFELMVTLGRKPATSRSTAVPHPAAAPPAPPSGSLLGLRALPVTEAVAVSLGLPRAAGAVVTRVVTGSPAELAGIPQGAVIVAVDGQDVANALELAARVRSVGAGKSIELSMYVDGKLVSREVLLGGGLTNNVPAPAASDAQAVSRLPETSKPTTEGSSGPSLGNSVNDGSQDDLHALQRKLAAVEDRLTRIEQLLHEVLAAQQAPAAVGEVDIDSVETEGLFVPK